MLLSRRWSLRAKWTAALVLTSSICLFFLAGKAYRIQEDGLKGLQRALASAVMDSSVRELRHLLESAADASHRMGLLLTEPSITSEEGRLELAREVLARAAALGYVAIYTPEGRLIDALVRHEGDATPGLREQLPRDVIEAASQGQWIAQPVAPQGMAISYVEMVVRHDERRALLLATLAPDLLATRLAQLAQERFGDDENAMLLIDGSARILASGKSGALGAGQSLAGKDVLAGGVVRTDQPDDLTREFVGFEGEPMLGSVRPLPEHGWLVALRRPLRSAISAQLTVTRNELLIAALALMAVAAAVGLYLGWRATRPVGQLVELTQAYGRREFTARSPVRSGDELETLGEALGTMAGQLADSERELLRRAAIEKDLSRYLPSEVAQAVAAGRSRLALGGERRTISVLFADLVSFTPFAENAGAEQVVTFLNELFTTLTEVIFRHHGMVDKFVGDCVMALFNAPDEQPDHVRRALATAEDMHRFVEVNAPAWKERYGIDVRLAIGIASGSAVVGNLGSERRMEYTAIGDLVNVAARLESLAQPGQTLVTHEVVTAAGAGFSFHALGEHPLRGKKRPVEIFELS